MRVGDLQVFGLSAAEEAEESVLGAILVAACVDVEAGFKTIDRVIATGLEPPHFYRESHARLYALMLDMRERGVPLDPVRVAAEIDPDDPHTLGRLHVLARQVVAFTAAARWAEIVRAAGMQRRLAA